MTLVEFVAYARKFLVAVTSALGVMALALSDGNVSTVEALQILVAFLGALGVYTVANQPEK